MSQWHSSGLPRTDACIALMHHLLPASESGDLHVWMSHWGPSPTESSGMRSMAEKSRHVHAYVNLPSEVWSWICSRIIGIAHFCRQHHQWQQQIRLKEKVSCLLCYSLNSVINIILQSVCFSAIHSYLMDTCKLAAVFYMQLFFLLPNKLLWGFWKVAYASWHKLATYIVYPLVIDKITIITAINYLLFILGLSLPRSNSLNSTAL